MKPGQLLSGRYRVKERLGAGGMGSVYMATIEALDDKKVAIKELSGARQGEDSEKAAEQFRKEASFLAHLNHPNLIPVTDYFVENDRSYLVMAYIEGDDLSQMLRRSSAGKFSPQQVEVWAGELCRVLGYLHSQDPPVLFRDLKPSNIMVDRDGCLKLIDFGIARSGESGSTTNTFLQGLGTSGFAALEQHAGAGTTDQRTDVYGLGATLYTLLTGKIPPDAAAQAAGLKSLTPISELEPDLPPKLSAAVMKCLQLKPENRYQNIASFQSDLTEPTEELTEDLKTLDLNHPGPPPEVPTTPSKRETESASESPPAPEKPRWPKLLLALFTLILLAFSLTFIGPKELDREATTRVDFAPEGYSDSTQAAAAAYAGLTWLRKTGANFELDSPAEFAPEFGDEGLSPVAFSDLVMHYLEEQRVESFGLEVDGWRDRHDDPAQLPHPNLSLLEDALAVPGTAAWMQVGWYRKDGDVFHRVSEEWVTAVEFELDTVTVVLHREGRAQVHDFEVLHLDREHTLEGELEGLPIDGSEQLVLEGDLPPPAGSDVPIVDSLMVLWLPEPPE